jgi:hypothetical protein
MFMHEEHTLIMFMHEEDYSYTHSIDRKLQSYTQTKYVGNHSSKFSNFKCSVAL